MFCEGSALLRSFLRRHGLLSGSKGPTWEQCLPLSDSVTTTLPVGLGHGQQPQAPVCGSFSRASLAISHRVALRSSIHPRFTWNPLRVSSTPAVCRDLSLSCLSASLDTLLVTARPLLGDTGHRFLHSPSPWPLPLDLGCQEPISPPHHHYPDIGSYSYEALTLWLEANRALCVCLLGGRGERG